MRNLAEYVMQGRKQAIWVAVLFSVLPFVGWIGTAIMALVTLRHGAKEGGLVALWILLPSIIFALVGYPQLWLYDVLGDTILTYILALVLRQFSSWAMMLEVGMLLGVTAVMLIHAVVPNIDQIWTKAINTYLLQGKAPSGRLNSLELQKTIQLLIRIATGLQVAFLLIVDFFNVMIARWAQSVLYNPGGLKRELLNIRLGLLGTSILVLDGIGVLAGIDFAVDCLPVVIVPFFIAGLSLVNYILIKAKSPLIWTVLFYGLLVVLFPYFTVLLVILALLDSWWNLRHRFQAKN